MRIGLHPRFFRVLRLTPFGSPRRERYSFGDALAFDHCDDAVGGNLLKHVSAPARPTNLQAIDLRRSPETEVLPEVALRQITRGRLDFADLCFASHNETQPGADALSVALLPNRSHDQRVVAVAAVVT